MSGSYPEFRWRDAGLDDAVLLSRLFVAGWRRCRERRPPDRWTRIVLASDPVGLVWFGREEGRLPGYQSEIETVYRHLGARPAGADLGHG